MAKIQLVISGDEKFIKHFNFTPVDKEIPADKVEAVKEALAVLDFLDGNPDGEVDVNVTEKVPGIHIGFLSIGAETIPLHIALKEVDG